MTSEFQNSSDQSVFFLPEQIIFYLIVVLGTTRFIKCIYQASFFRLFSYDIFLVLT